MLDLAPDLTCRPWIARQGVATVQVHFGNATDAINLCAGRSDQDRMAPSQLTDAAVYDEQQNPANQPSCSGDAAGMALGALQHKYDSLNVIIILTEAVAEAACLADQAECDSMNASLKATFSKLYRLEGESSLPASTCSAPGGLEMQQQVAAAVADQHAAVLQRLSEVDHTGVDTHVVQRRLLQAAVAGVVCCNTAHRDIVSQAPGPDTQTPSNHPHFDPDTPRAATSKLRRTDSSTSLPGMTLSLPLQQSTGSVHKSSMPPPPDRVPSVPSVLSFKVGAPSSSKPVSTGSPSTPAGTPGKQSERLSQVSWGVFSESLHPVTTAVHPSIPAARKSAALPSSTPTTCIAPPPPHPAPALAGLAMEMEGPILEDESCLLDPSQVFHQELIAEASAAAERQHKPDVLSGRQAPPYGLRDPIHEAQPKQQQQQQQQHATYVGTAAQGLGVASEHVNKANGDANNNPISRAAAGVKSPTAVQQSQLGTRVAVGPVASAAPHFFSGISEQTCNNLLAEVNAAEELALKEGRQLLSVDRQLYLGGRPTSHPLQWAPVWWNADEQCLEREDSATLLNYSDLHASSPVVVSTGLVGHTQQRPLHVAPQQGQRLVTQTGGPVARTYGQPCSVAGCDARQQSDIRVQGAQPGSQAGGHGAKGSASAPWKKGAKKRSRSADECAKNGTGQGVRYKKVKRQRNLGNAAPAPMPSDQQLRPDVLDDCIDFDSMGDMLAADCDMMHTLDDMCF
ncbi:hypothetical protein ABBQ32_002342 [Trebouxia sp. C0010 RCD-2024]